MNLPSQVLHAVVLEVAPLSQVITLSAFHLHGDALAHVLLRLLSGSKYCEVVAFKRAADVNLTHLRVLSRAQVTVSYCLAFFTAGRFYAFQFHLVHKLLRDSARMDESCDARALRTFIADLFGTCEAI